MRSSTRHQLKQDQFAETVTEQLSWAIGHQKTLILVAAAVVVVAASVIGYMYYMNGQEQKASVALGGAMKTYDAFLRGENVPPDPQIETYTSAMERAKAAIPKFQSVVSHYGSTHSGAVARYLLGVSLMNAGDNAGAEAQLKEMSGSSDKDLAALSKMALAALYRNTSREPQAAALYKEIIDKPTNTVSKSAAQLEMASMYSSKDRSEARKLYEQVSKENPNTMAANIANSRIAELK